MQAAFNLIEDYEASNAEAVPVKQLTDSFIVVGKPLDPSPEDEAAALARARKELEDSILQSRLAAEANHKEAAKISSEPLILPNATSSPTSIVVEDKKKEESVPIVDAKAAEPIAPTALQALPVESNDIEPIEPLKGAFILQLKKPQHGAETEEEEEEKALEDALNAPALPTPSQPATADEVVAQIVAAENLAPVVDTRNDAVLAHALAAQIAGGVDAVALARREEQARQARLRDVKAVQKRIDEERKKAQMMREVKKEANTAAGAGEKSREVLLKGGEVLVWGKGTDGQLGIPKCPKVQLIPTPLPFFADKIITQVAAGRNHTLLLAQNGALYSFGVYGAALVGKGQCGHGDFGSCLSPRPIAALEGANVRYIAAGDAHSACVTDTAVLLTWGSALWGQLGVGKSKDSKTKPTPVPDLTNVMKVACGAMHTIVLLTNGESYAWGNNDYGQLGLSEFQKNKVLHSTPQLVRRFLGPGASQPTHISCGQHHSAWLAGGKLYTSGMNSEGQLGLGDQENRFGACLVDLKEPAVEVACGGAHTLVRTTSGRVFCFGRNSHGQCAFTPCKELSLPRPLSHTANFVSIAASENSSAAISQLGEVYTWGEGGFGQLGHESRADVAVPTTIPFLANVSVRHIALGAAHSVALVNSLTAVAQDLKVLLSTGQLADLVLNAGSRRLPVHKAIISRSPFFQSLIAAQPDSASIDVNDMTADDLATAVEVVYTDSVRLTGEQAAAFAPTLEKLALPVASKSAIAAAKGEDALSTYLASLLETGKHGDVIFHFPLKNQKLVAHRAILSARCEYFRSMFLSGMKEAESPEIQVNDVRLPAFRRLLAFLYTGHCTFNTDGSLAVELLMISHRYRVFPLKGLCESLIEAAVTSSNCLMLFELADVHQAGRVRAKALAEAVTHASSFAGTPEWTTLPPALQAEIVALIPKHIESRAIQKTNSVSAAPVSKSASEALENATIADYNSIRPSKEFAATLTRARDAKNMSIAELATQVGEKASLIRSIEQGKGILSVRLVERLERVLKTRLRHLAQV